MFAGWKPHPAALAFIAILSMSALPAPASAQGWFFTDVTSQANASYNHGYIAEVTTNRRSIAAGVAAGDYDNDGWVDLFMICGEINPNVLMHNEGDGTFTNRTVEAGLSLTGKTACGPLFVDLDGDGWLDLIRGGVENTNPAVYLNKGDGTFEDVTATSGILTSEDMYSITAGDYDRDGDLDLLTSHWWGAPEVCSRLWRNEGNMVFSCADEMAGTLLPRSPMAKFGFTPNFADINSDGWPDILIASDFGTSQVYLNQGDGTFDDVTTPVISDQNGMGGAIGDYDNDGDLDWFVSSIWDLDGAPGSNGPLTGNRMYKNDGSGNFVDATDETGTRHGWWGWGASFADFNNDGHLDLYHVNGYPIDDPEFVSDPALLFISGGDGTFTESAREIGARYLDQGRGIVCFDYDRDGDIDIFVAPANGSSALYRNDGGNKLNYLAVKLHGPEGNSEGIGARVYATVGGMTQMRELRAGSNFVSQDPAEAHFGLGDAATVDVLRVRWLDGATSEFYEVAANQRMTVEYTQISATPPISRVRLLDVAPNPSTGSFTFRVELPGGATGSVVVYDVRGRIVGTAGPFTSTGETRSVVWDGMTTPGNAAVTGVYFARVESAAGTSESKRIAVIR